MTDLKRADDRCGNRGCGHRRDFHDARGCLVCRKFDRRCEKFTGVVGG